MPPRTVAIALSMLLIVAAALYALALRSGVVTFVGYEARSETLVGAGRSSTFPIEVVMPVWLAEGQAIRADFEVDAAFGSVSLRVAPPLWWRTPLQAATAYVEGKRSGSILFVAGAPGWYMLEAEPSAIGGPRCGPAHLDLKHIVIGDPKCPVYDVNYRVTWHLAAAQDLTGALPRLQVPRANGTLATLHIRN